MTTIRVRDDEVLAAQIQIRALIGAGLTPDPLLVALAEATLPEPGKSEGAAVRPARRVAPRPVRTAAVGGHTGPADGS